MIRRKIELREEAGKISGVLMKYGDVAPTYQERFEVGSLGDVAALDVVVNLQHSPEKLIARSHGGGLELSEIDGEIRFTLSPVNTQTGQETRELIKAGIIRGASVEFHSAESRMENGIRVISRAELVGFGLVTRPAYKETSVSARKESKKRRKLYL